MSTADTLTCVFCLVRSARRPRVPAVSVTGGLAVRLLEAGASLWLAVASVPAASYGEEALARGLQDLEWIGPRALVHEAVVEHFLGTNAVLPMQLFTLFTSDERAIRHVVRDRRRVTRILDRIEGRVEWGVRFTFDEAARREADSAAHLAGARASDRPAHRTGTAYLARKRDQMDAARIHLDDARRRAVRACRELTDVAEAVHRRASTEQSGPGSRLLVDAAFLVHLRSSTTFRAAARRLSRGLAGNGVTLTVTGPWPAYNFIDHQTRRPRRKVR